MLVVNKVDIAKKELLLVLTSHLNEAIACKETFMVSALSGDGTEPMLDLIAAEMPISPWLYPEDEVSDLPQRMLAAEITREKLFLTLAPGAALRLCRRDYFLGRIGKTAAPRIDQIIYVTRDSQKPIVLGKGGPEYQKCGGAGPRGAGRASWSTLTFIFAC